MEIKTTDKLYVPAYLLTKEDMTDEVIQWFKKAVKYNTFIYTSTEQKKIVGYGESVPFELLQEIAPLLSKEMGLNINAELCYCGHGPFIALTITE